MQLLQNRQHDHQPQRAPREPRKKAMSQPPNDLPIYRVLTGPDNAAFCRRVSEALEMGYQLHGAPAVTFNGSDVIVAQAVLWPRTGD
jgi:hypothetical protein